MKTIVFFNQAAGDIVHILKIYDQLMSSSTDYTFKIVCFNNERICEVYRYSMCNMSGRWIVFRYPKEIIPHMTELHPVLDSVICKKYAVKIDSNVNKTALLFTQPNRDHQLISNEEHDEIQRSVAKKLKDAGYTLVLKGHPTIGICEAVRPYADVIVPQIIPGELLDFSQVHSCYAFLSIALASTAKLGICSYSFLPLMKSHESVNYQEALSFITETGEGKILLLNSLNEID